MKYFQLIIVLLFSLSIQAQFKCGDQMFKKIQEQNYPGYQSAIQSTYKDALNATPKRNGSLYTIPVVVHVVYNTDDQDISDDLIADQIAILNENFRHQNENAADLREVFQPLAGDAMIEFVLADVDPNGNPTTGITRTTTDRPSFVELDFTAILAAIGECGVDITDQTSIEENLDCILEIIGEGGNINPDEVKSSITGGKDPWDQDRYMNIWVCNMGVDFGTGNAPFILGLAYPPVGAPNWPNDQLPDNIDELDGVIVHYQAFGKDNPQAGPLVGLNDQGRTLVHEVGHYLGLRHVWGDGDCTMDDFIEDTPVMGSNSQSQEATAPSCGSLHIKDTCTEDNLPDLIENYMDYSPEICQSMFSIQQIDLMRNMLEGPRIKLIEGQVSATIDIVDHDLAIYPNPASNIIEITASNAVQYFEIFDLSGHLVMKRKSLKTDVSSLKTGVYLLRATFDSGIQTKKLMIK